MADLDLSPYTPGTGGLHCMQAFTTQENPTATIRAALRLPPGPCPVQLLNLRPHEDTPGLEFFFDGAPWARIPAGSAIPPLIALDALNLPKSANPYAKSGSPPPFPKTAPKPQYNSAGSSSPLPMLPQYKPNPLPWSPEKPITLSAGPLFGTGEFDVWCSVQTPDPESYHIFNRTAP